MPSVSKQFTLVLCVISIVAAFYVYINVPPSWVESQLRFETYTDNKGNWMYQAGGKTLKIDQIVDYENSPLRQSALTLTTQPPTLKQQWVWLSDSSESADVQASSLVLLKADFHYGLWSLLPAFIAILLCLITKEPFVALLSGIVVGAIIMGQFDIFNQVLIPAVGTTSAASILILYLWLLGGLMGVWGKTGAAQAFAEYMSKHYVKGPRSAKLVAWFLGIIFFQGGTMSTVLVGTTVKPIADKAKVSHEELSYVVDSTASPVAALIAFNAWPAYIQGFLFIPGVAFLATESQRVAFFFASVPFSFYAIFAVIGTLLLSLNITIFSGPLLKKASTRASTTGELDSKIARPISAKELHNTNVPKGYKANLVEFLLPLVSLICVAVITHFNMGSPQIHWAFATALFIAASIALIKGMSLHQLLEGLGDGLKGVVFASVILMLALTIGLISRQLGGGIFLVESLGDQIPFWALPLILQGMTMLIAFSTGTSWGTYAIAFPLAMPLAWSLAQSQNLAHPELYLMICFATVLNGSVYGDQCSPISDTTILSAMTTGCDLMDHVKSQILPASYAAMLAGLCWTLSALILT